MKLQKRLGRKYNNKEYYKWMVVIPEDEVVIAGFKEGEELKIYSEDGKITLIRD